MDDSKVQIVGDQLVVRLGPLLGPARRGDQRTPALKVPRRLPAGEEPQIVLGDASDLESVRGLVDLLQKLAWLLPVPGADLLGVGAVCGPTLRRGILRAGLALAAAMLVLGAAPLIGARSTSTRSRRRSSPRTPRARPSTRCCTLHRNGSSCCWRRAVVALGAFLAGRIRRAPSAA